MITHNKSDQPSILVILSILFSATTVLAYTYYYTVDKPYLDKRLVLHQEIIAGEAVAPYQYRLLVPYTAEILFKINAVFLPDNYAFTLAYVLVDLAGLFLLIITIYYFLSIWFDWRYAMMGTLFCAALLTLTYQEHYFQPWSFWEAAFFTIALILIYKRYYIWLVVIIVLASLNRETALMIPLVFLLTTQDFFGWINGKGKLNTKQLAWFIGFGLLWLAVYWLLRVIRPETTHIETFREILRENLIFVNIAKTGLNLTLFMGAFWLLALWGWKKAPLFIRRAALITLCYAPFYLMWAYWREVRVLMFFYPIILALGLSALPGSIDTNQEDPNKIG